MNLHYNPKVKDQLPRCGRMKRGRFMPKKQKSRSFIKLKCWEEKVMKADVGKAS